MKVPTLAAALLFALTSAASAECAWVLWMRGVLSPNIRWEPHGAYSTNQTCLKAGQDTYGRWNAQNTNPETKVTFLCLPDTVDPRGPKGK
jgi:hypothetical protein